MEVGGPAKEEDERRKLKDGSWRSDDGDCLIGAIEANQLGEPFFRTDESFSKSSQVAPLSSMEFLFSAVLRTTTIYSLISSTLEISEVARTGSIFQACSEIILNSKEWDTSTWDHERTPHR